MNEGSRVRIIGTEATTYHFGQPTWDEDSDKAWIVSEVLSEGTRIRLKGNPNSWHPEDLKLEGGLVGTVEVKRIKK